MIKNTIKQLKDDVIGANYDLCVVTYKELRDKVISDSGMTEAELFNFDSKGERTFIKPVEKPEKVSQFIEIDPTIYPEFTQEMYDAYMENIEDVERAFHKFDLVKRRYIEKMEKQIRISHIENPLYKVYLKQKEAYEVYTNNEAIREEKASIKIEKVASGIEQYSFIVEEDEEGKWTLLDGFNRLFGAYYPNNDKELILKVYPTLSREKYSKLIDSVNSWKREKEGRGSLFFDRGVRLSLYLKYGLRLDTTYDNPERMIGYFYESYQVTFFEYFGALNTTGNIVDNLELLLNYKVAESKRPEGKYVYYPEMEVVVLKMISKNPTLKTVEEITALFEDKKIEKEFEKIKNYKVQGFAENYFYQKTGPKIDKYIEERLEQQVTKLKEI